MPEPFIFIGTHRLKEGKLSDFEASWKELVDVVEAKEPQSGKSGEGVVDDGVDDHGGTMTHSELRREDCALPAGGSRAASSASHRVRRSMLRAFHRGTGDTMLPSPPTSKISRSALSAMLVRMPNAPKVSLRRERRAPGAVRRTLHMPPHKSPKM